MVAEGKPIKAIAAAPNTTPAAVDGRRRAAVPAPRRGCLGRRRRARSDRLRRLHQAIVDREEQGETLSRLLPARRRRAGCAHGALSIGETEKLDVTVLMSDIRGYSTIAEHADPSPLAAQLNRHRAAMNRAILGGAAP